MKHPITATAAFLCLCLSLPPLGQAAPADKNTKKHRVAPPGVTIEWDLSYLEADRTDKLDLYLPKNRARNVLSPAVVIIHGGGWIKNDKSDDREFIAGTTLAKQGYVCVSINYWMNPKDDPKTPLWPRNLHDCKNAVRWLRKHARKYQVDTNHIGVLGGSAGGHLALMVAYTHGNKKLEPRTPYPGFSDEVHAVVDMYGLTDLLTRYHVGPKFKDKKHKEWYASNLLPHPGKKVSAKKSLLDQATARIGEDKIPDWMFASPINHVKKSSPPTLIIHGTADPIVDLDQSIELQKKLDATVVANKVIWVKDGLHAFSLDGTYEDGKPKIKDPSGDVRGEVVAFFDKYLKSSR